MTRSIGIVVVFGIVSFLSCTKKESVENKPAPEAAPPAATSAAAPHAVVNLKDGSKVPGTIVASSQNDMVVAGDDGIERKIPLGQVKSVDYVEASKTASTPPPASSPSSAPPPRKSEPATRAAKEAVAPSPTQATPHASDPATPTLVPSPPVVAKTYELPSTTVISVRTNESIDSGTAAEGQRFDAQVTRDVRDASGSTVIPRGSDARVVIKSASKGGRFRGASDLVLDLQSVVIHGRSHVIDTVDVSQKGKSGVGANKRTAEYTGGGAALGAIIGAIAGGGKGAAIGAGAGAGAGALTQILTKGGAIKVPAESVLTFRLDKPLRVTAAE